MANPMKHAPASSGFTNLSTVIIISNSTLMRSTPMLMPDWVGISETARGLPFSAAKAMRLLAMLLINMPNQATMNDPVIPMTDQARIRATVGASLWLRNPK